MDKTQETIQAVRHLKKLKKDINNTHDYIRLNCTDSEVLSEDHTFVEIVGQLNILNATLHVLIINYNNKIDREMKNPSI